MGWGGVGCDSTRHYCKIWCDATLRIRLYCKTWCDATLRIRHYCKTWWDATLRMGWGGVVCDSISHYCKIWCDATLRIRLYSVRAHTGGVDGYWKVMQKVNSRQHSFPSPRQTQWFVVQIHSKSPMEMGTHWLRLAYRHWRSCKISHAVKRKGHFDPSPGFEAQNPVRVANHCKTDVFFSWLFPTWNRAGATAKQ